MRKGIHGGAAALRPREIERQLRVVDDPREVGAASAADHVLLRVADAVEGRPLRAGVRRRDGHERQLRHRRHGLSQIDRAAAADGQDRVRALCVRRDLRDPVARHLAPAACRGEVEVGPPGAGDQEGPLTADVGKHAGKLLEAPADDHFN